MMDKDGINYESSAVHVVFSIMILFFCHFLSLLLRKFRTLFGSEDLTSTVRVFGNDTATGI